MVHRGAVPHVTRVMCSILFTRQAHGRSRIAGEDERSRFFRKCRLSPDAGRAVARAAGASAAGRRREIPSGTPSRANCSSASASTACSIPASPFLELSPLAAWEMYDGEAPGAGIVTGIGRVAGRECLIVANDATVKGGTYFPMTVKKHLRAQQIAEENHLPCIYLVDSGGAFLPMQDEVFPDADDFGRIFYNQARMSAQGHPADRRRDGIVHGGRRVRPGHERRDDDRAGHGHDLPGRAAAGQGGNGRGRDRRRTGRRRRSHAPVGRGRSFCAGRRSRAGDCAAASWRRSTRARRVTLDIAPPEEPLYDPQELYGILPRTFRETYDVREVIARLVDGSRFREFKARYGDDAGVRLCADRGLSGRHHRQQRRAVQRVGAQGRALHRVVRRARHSAAVSAEHHRLHGRARSTRRAGSPKTARRWCMRWPTRRFPSSPSSSAARSARAITACAGAPMGRVSCGCGPTAASASWAASRRPTCC